MILGEDDPKTVVQSEFFEGNVERLGQLSGGLIVGSDSALSSRVP